MLSLCLRRYTDEDVVGLFAKTGVVCTMLMKYDCRKFDHERFNNDKNEKRIFNFAPPPFNSTIGEGPVQLHGQF